MNHIYVSNEVFDACYVDYIDFKKYEDDIINNLNAKKNKVCEKSGCNREQSKLKFLQAEILKLRNENTSLKDNNKYKLKLLNHLPLVNVAAQLLTKEKL